MNFDEIEVKINKPYPEIVNAKEDLSTVAILKNLATSRHSELSAVLQYIYQSVVADKVMSDIGAIFEEIGIVEMMHLDMLMHAIVEFGGIPKYEDTQGNMFNVSGINYTIKLKDMLDNNIAEEKIAIETYKQAINKLKNESLKRLIERFIEDEERHLEIFKKIRNNVTFLSV